MPILDSLKPFLKEDANLEQVGEALKGLNPLESLTDFETQRAQVLDLIKDNDVLSRAFDFKVTQSVENFKKNNYQNDLKKGIDDEIAKRYPAESDEQKRERERDERITALEKENAEEKRQNKRLENYDLQVQALEQDKLSGPEVKQLLKILVTDDVEKSESAAKLLKAALGAAAKQAVKDLLDGQTIPPSEGGDPTQNGNRGKAYDEAVARGDFSSALQLATPGKKG